MHRSDVLIVGAGHGGAQAAIALRQHKYDGTITVVGDEPDLPYERPPLSKDYLSGEKAFERIMIRPPAFWDERQIAFKLGARVVKVAADRHEVELQNGEVLGYGKLIWATGGAPRRLTCDGSTLGGIHAIRNRADVDTLMTELAATLRVVVIGGGYIGLEAAAVLSKLGKQVVLLEALDRVLARVAGPAISAFYEAEHRAHGVDLRTGVTVTCIEGEGGMVTGVRLADDSFVEADMVIVGIGIVPAVAPLLEAGAAGTAGVDIDDFCATSLPDVYAIGDCAAHESRFAAGSRIRLESVQNANDQAQVAARGILGQAEPYGAVPWFWSNQYDLKLQTVGLSIGYDETVVRGDPAARSFSVVYLRDGQVIALDCVNAVKDYVQGKALVQNEVRAPRDKLADTSLPLKAIAA